MRALAMVGLGCASALAACGSVTASTASIQPDLTSRQIHLIVAQYAAENNTANRAVSLSQQALDETGSALKMDDAVFRYELQAVQGPSYEQQHYVPFFFHVVSEQVLAVRSWPRHFLALAVPTASPTASASTHGSCADAFAFVQNRRGGRWRVESEPPVPRGALGDLRLTPVSDPIAVTDPHLAEDPLSLTGELANAIGTWGSGGPAPTWLPRRDAACFGLDFVGTAARKAQVEHYMFDLSTEPASGSGAILTFALRGGGALVIVTLRVQQSLSAASPSSFSVHSAYGDLQPGQQYQALSYPGMAEVAVLDPPRGRGRPVILGAYDTDLWPATGTPVSGSRARRRAPEEGSVGRASG